MGNNLWHLYAQVLCLVYSLWFNMLITTQGAEYMLALVYPTVSIGLAGSPFSAT